MSKFEEIFIKEKMRFAIVLFVGLILGFSQCNSSDSTANEKLSLDQFLVEIGKEKLTMVDFYTTWCGPCKQMAPFIEEIKMENKDVVNVLKVDAEDQIDIAYHVNVFIPISNIMNNIIYDYQYYRINNNESLLMSISNINEAITSNLEEKYFIRDN